MKPPLRVATCQFAVDGKIEHNWREIVRQMAEAADHRARVVHFPETALSGYARFDVPSTAVIDWGELRAATEEICQAAARHRLWVLLGSSHPLTPPHKPHNCVYVINDQGQIVDRYDKRFCTGDCELEPTLDLSQYTPGNHTCTFDIDGYRCAVLICYDYRFVELYRELKRLGVEVLFHSYHNARFDRETFETGNLWKEVVPAIMQAAAAQNHFWISANNSTAEYSLWPSFFVRANGTLGGQLLLHEPGVLISDVDWSLPLWDAAAPWRERSMQGVLHSGELVDDPRSRDRHSL